MSLILRRYLCDRFQCELARHSCSTVVLTGLGSVGPPAFQFWALHFLPLIMLVVAFIRFCSGAAHGIKRSENFFLFCFVLPLATLLLVQSCLVFDSLCNQLIDGTSTREGQEWEAWSQKGQYQCLTLISLRSCGTAENCKTTFECRTVLQKEDC